MNAGVVDRRLITGGLALAAAVALGLAGSTFAAFNDFTDVPGNVIGAGVLVLDLGMEGSASAALSLDNLTPGTTRSGSVWIATNDVSSTLGGTLSVTVHNLVDVAAPCNAGGDKADGEIESGIGGCTLVGDTATGTPEQGNLSRVIAFDVAYQPAATDPASCNGATATRSAMAYSGRGNLHAAATANGGSGSTVQLTDGSAPLLVGPGQAVCVVVTTSWPQATARPDAEHPSDNAAQGDSLTVDVRFDLTQVTP